MDYLESLRCGVLGVTRDLLKHSTATEEAASTEALSTPFSNISQQNWVAAVSHWNENGRHLIKGLDSRCCPACSGTANRFIFESYDGYPYHECKTCAAWYVPLKVEQELFDRFFKSCSAAEDLALQSFEARKSSEYKEASLERIGGYIDFLMPWLKDKPAPLSYLDIGCGLGYSLEAGQLRGLQSAGTESSDYCVNYGLVNGLDVRSASSFDRGARFNLISFWESLEHISDPRAALLQSLDQLEAHGLVAFTVPNRNSPLLRLQREDSSIVHGGYDTPGHVNLFDPDSIRILFERAGLSILFFDGQYGMNPIEFFGYMTGDNRGAYDMLNGRLTGRSSSITRGATLQAIGPSITIMERVLLMSPILFGVACRRGMEGHFESVAKKAASERHAQLMTLINDMDPGVDLVYKFEMECKKNEELQRQLSLVNSPIKRLIKLAIRHLNLFQG